MSLNKRPRRLRCASRHTHAPQALNVFAKPHHVSRGSGSFGSIGESFRRFDFFFVFFATGCHLHGNQQVCRVHRQFFTKSILGDDAAVLARSNG